MKRGLIILIISAFAFMSNAEIKRIYHDSITEIADSTVLFHFPDKGLSSMAIEMRESLHNAKPGFSSDSFGILWNESDDGKSFYSASLQPVSGHNDEIIDSRYVLFKVLHKQQSECVTIYETRLKDGFGMEREENTLGVDIDIDSAIVRIYGGDVMPERIHEIKLPGEISNTMGIEAHGATKISLLVTESTVDNYRNIQTSWTEEEIDRYLKGADFPEGRYRYLDRETDSKYARLGGRYELALISDGEGAFDLIYLGGATTNSRHWRPGMLKGKLKPTIFTGHYDLEWYDSSSNVTSSECSADIEQRAILKLNFPLLKSAMRFSVVPKGK